MSDISNPPAPPLATSAVTFDPKSETVTLPGGVVSVAGVTVVTGGAELSWGSCLLAFGVWGTLIGVSVIAVGLWDVSTRVKGGTSHLLSLGLVVLAISSGVVVAVIGCRFLRRKGMIGRREADDGKVVLVGERGRSCVKTVTV
ncbi:transmembrane protein 100-like [Megalops cyprinoides]|uniref:transmembrane protein 100-like n=1 Tax=Megalops cyprinoides TaxID=118141 RepID=UPI00186455AC|nr:transmembrane protein 100-like [Megalops cyprinoides]XP_036394200.1 transmembrane protein 100-like [Megalops cyprinoides]